MKLSSRRAEYLARASLGVSIVFFVATLLIGRWSGFFGVSAVSWLILGAALIWFVLTVQFHQRCLAEQEKLDMTQLGKDQESAIFEAKGERATLFAVAQRRLAIFEKWFIPIFSVAIAVYQLAIGLYLLKTVSTADDDIEAKQALICAVCLTAVAFVSFLISRYATGMSSHDQWKPLRAGGSFLLAVAVLCFALGVGLAMAHFQKFIALAVINWLIPILLIIVGVETALNVVLDIYRPRLKGQYSRAAFDSRLLGIIGEPGGVFRSAAGAIDYQFGFEVSQTWFYKLLEKAIVPLTLFSAVTLYLLSCVIVLEPNEQAIIEHFGNPVNTAGRVRLVGPGLTFKWPWPIDIAYKYPAKKVMELSIGFVPKINPKTKEVIPETSLLWGKAHYEQEYNLLVAAERTNAELAPGAVPVSLITAAVPVQYRVRDLYSFIYNHNEPQSLLESICYRELTRFAASAKIQVDETIDMDQSLLGAGRARAKQILTAEIQKAADEENLGVEIVFVGLQGLHPPPEVAADYQKVVGAVQKKQALILNAQAERNTNLSTLAGSVEKADRLYTLAAEYQHAKEENKSDKVERLADRLDTAFARASGDIFTTLRKAQGYAFEKATLARGTGERFAGQLSAYHAARDIYKRRQRLAAFEEGLENIRKYVKVVGPNHAEVIIVDVQEKLMPSLYEITGLEESREK